MNKLSFRSNKLLIAVQRPCWLSIPLRYPQFAGHRFRMRRFVPLWCGGSYSEWRELYEDFANSEP